MMAAAVLIVAGLFVAWYLADPPMRVGPSPDEDGRVLNDRMTNSIIPTAIEAPEMETILLEVPYPHGPHGAKGIGELPMDGPAAAVAGAIEDALGVPFDELPILPERVFEAVERARDAGTEDAA